jgi:hypothetical protein
MLDLAAALPVRRCLPGEALGLRAGLPRRDQRSHGCLLRGLAGPPVGVVPAAVVYGYAPGQRILKIVLQPDGHSVHTVMAVGE